MDLLNKVFVFDVIIVEYGLIFDWIMCLDEK